MLNEELILEYGDSGSKRMTGKEHLLFLSNRIIEITNNIESLSEDEKKLIIKEAKEIIAEPKQEHTRTLIKLATYLEEKL